MIAILGTRPNREDVENEWQVKLDEEIEKRQEKEAWADELVKQLEGEKKVSQGECVNAEK